MTPIQNDNIEPVIAPVSVEAIKAELTPERLLRHTNKGGNMIYVADGRECPAIMRELGRLREVTFRAAGGGTGKACDIDRYDLMSPPCRQLFVWDPDSEQILGGYRFIIGTDVHVSDEGVPRLATAHMFRFSKKFIDEYLPYTLELGRSFVRPEYQSSKAGAKALFALDNLWDGLGALTVVHPSIKYLFGKVTMYPTYHRQCRNMILHLLHKHFSDPDNLVRPFHPIDTGVDTPQMEQLFTGADFKADYPVLNAEIRKLGYTIPPLVNAYMGLSPSMRSFGTGINDEFGDVEETGIMVTVSEIYEAKKSRHIDTYSPA